MSTFSYYVQIVLLSDFLFEKKFIGRTMSYCVRPRLQKFSGEKMHLSTNHNDPEFLENGNRPLFHDLFLKPNCDQNCLKCPKFYFWTHQRMFQTLSWKKKISVKTRFFWSKSDFFGNNRPKSGQKIDCSKPNLLHLLRNFVRIPEMGDFLL